MTLSPLPELTQIRRERCERHTLGAEPRPDGGEPIGILTGIARAMHDLSSERRIDRADLPGPSPSGTAPPCRRSGTRGRGWLFRCQGRRLYPALRSPCHLRSAASEARMIDAFARRVTKRIVGDVMPENTGVRVLVRWRPHCGRIPVGSRGRGTAVRVDTPGRTMSRVFDNQSGRTIPWIRFRPRCC